MYKDLSEKSVAYYGLNDCYEIFSMAEDYPGHVEKELLKFATGKIVLDAGCGSGKYLSTVENVASKLYAVDASKEQLNIAKTKVKNKENVIQADLVALPFEDNTFDLIYATWVLGTIIEEEKRKKALLELNRVLRPNGRIILVENNIGGQFEMMRDRYPNTERTKGYNEWVLSQGFKTFKEIDSYFEFANESISKHVFREIYGEKVSLLAKQQIEHKIVMFIYEK